MYEHRANVKSVDAQRLHQTQQFNEEHMSVLGAGGVWLVRDQENGRAPTMPAGRMSCATWRPTPERP